MKFKSNIEIQAGLEDASGSPGTVNQLLSSTATGTAWIDPSTIVAEAASLVVIACKNTSGAAIPKGTPVYQTGNVGATATIEIAPADALISANKLPAIGVLQTDLNNNGFGNVVITGELTNLTTSPIDGVVPTTGDKIFVKSGGGLTLTKPTGEGNGIQNMGLVGKVSSGNSGSITVSSIMRTNDVPNLPEGRIWVGDGNTIVSDTVYVDEPNNRVGIGTIIPGTLLEISGNSQASTPALRINCTDSSVQLNQVAGAVQFSVNDASTPGAGVKTSINSIALNSIGSRYGLGFNTTSGVNNVERMRIDEDGNVGIGTTNPGTKLEVAGITTIKSPKAYGSEEAVLRIGVTSSGTNYSDGTFHNIVFGNESVANSHLGEIQVVQGDASASTASDMRFFTNSGGGNTATNEAMRITSVGNVGIGTINPVADLQVSSTKDGMTNGVNTNQLKLSHNASVVGMGSSVAFGVSGNNNFTGAKIVHERTASNSVGDLTFWTRGTAGTSTDYDLTVERMRIDSAGAIKFNAYSAGTLVSDASGNITVSSGGGAGGPYLPLSAGDSYPLTGNLVIEGSAKVLRLKRDANQSWIQYVGSNDDFVIRDETDGRTAFVAEGGGDVYFPGGNVGIGTTNPAKTLHIQTNDSAYGSLRIQRNSTTQGETSIGFFGKSDTPYNEAWVIGENGWGHTGKFVIGNENGGAGGNVRMTIQRDGNVGIGTTSPSTELDVDGVVTATGGNSTEWNSAYDYTNGQNNSIQGKWYSGDPHNYVSGVSYYTYTKVANLVGNTTNASFEYYVKRDFNYPGVVKGSFTVTTYNGSSMSVQHDLSTGKGTMSPQVYIDNSRNIWIRFAGAAWTTVMRWRCIFNSGVTIYDGTTSQNTQPTNSALVIPGDSLKFGWNDISNRTVNNNTFEVYAAKVTDDLIVSGDVGIGVTSIAAKLSVAAGTGSPTVLLGRATGQASIKAGTDSSGHLIIDSSTGHVYINNYVNKNIYLANGGGNVGIGTDSPSEKLSISGAKNTPIIHLGSTTNNTSWSIGDKIGAIEFGSADGSGAGSGVKASISYEVEAGTTGSTNSMVFSTAGTSAGTNNTERMRITAAGNVGIGTPSPDNILHIRNGDTTYASQVGADTMLFLETTNVSNALQFTSANTGQQYIMFGDDDPNVGWISYNHSDNNLNFRVNGSEKMRISTAGNVGIGTTIPSKKLDVAGTAKAEGFYSHSGTYTSNTHSGKWQKVYSHNWSTFSFSAFTLKVLCAGNTANNNINADVHINYKMQNGGYRVYANIVNYGSEALLAENFKINLSVTSAASGSWTIWHKLTSTYQEPFYTIAGSGISGTWYNETPVASPTGDDDTWTERIIINSMSTDVDNSGNVGIGTTTPGAKLDVDGAVITRGNLGFINYATQSEAYYTKIGTQYSYNESFLIEHKLQKIMTYSDNNAFGLALNGAGLIRFMNGSGEKMRISDAGNVGIGTTNPTAGRKLDVHGDIETTDDIFIGAASSTNSEHKIKIGQNRSGNGYAYIDMIGDAGAGSNYNLRIIRHNSGANALSQIIHTGTGNFEIKASNGGDIVLNSSGSIGISQTSPSYKLDVTGDGRFTSTVTATNFILSSDERLKENVEKVCDNRVKADWKTFELKTEKGQKRYGVIAQELEKTNPEFVREDSQGFKSVAYIDLLIAKIAELEARLEKLEK